MHKCIYTEHKTGKTSLCPEKSENSLFFARFELEGVCRRLLGRSNALGFDVDADSMDVSNMANLIELLGT